MTARRATISNMLRTKEKAALANHVTKLVKAHPLPRKEIAELAHVADGAIGNMMYGKGNPTLDSLVKIARFFNIATADLLRDGDDSTILRAQESLALYHSDPQLNGLISTFQQLTTADQQEFMAAMHARADKNAAVVRELGGRNSPAAAAFKPAVSDQDVERKMRLKSPGK